MKARDQVILTKLTHFSEIFKEINLCPIYLLLKKHIK